MPLLILAFYCLFSVTVAYIWNGLPCGNQKSPSKSFENSLALDAAKKTTYKTQRSPKSGPKENNDKPRSSSPSNLQPIVEKPAAAPRSFAAKTILGQDITVIREFKLDAKRNFNFLGSYSNFDLIPKYPLAEIAFVGRSNVGKSSLLNSISGLAKALAVESKTPGRTQLINMFHCKDNEGDICIFTDLPGYGYAKISKEQQDQISTFVNRYLTERDTLRLTIVLVDARREPSEADYQMIKFLSESGVPYAIVATKCDKLSKNELQRSITTLRSAYGLPPSQPIAFSAITGEGKKDVWRVIKDAMLGRGLYDESVLHEGQDEIEDGQDDEGDMDSDE